MHLAKLKLWNFRKFGLLNGNEINSDNAGLTVHFTEGLNVIIGENDSGKTAIIDSIKLVLKTHSYDFIRVEDKDFHKDASHFRIELYFEGFDPEEAKNFIEWLGWEGVGEKSKPYLKVIYSVFRNSERILPSDVKAGADNQGYPLTAEARDYLKLTYLKPLRDAENELVAKRNSRLSQILLGDSAFKGKEKNHELVEVFSKISDELKKYFKGEFQLPVYDENGKPSRSKEGEPLFTLPQEGKMIKDKIDTYVKGFYGNAYETEFETSYSDIKSILEKLALLLKDEIHPGLGTLNRLFMAAELLHLDKSDWDGLRLGLVEEIEAHLHPQAQMQVIEALQKQHSIQLILTTHSPNLASKLKLENLIICKGGNVYPMGHHYTALGEDQYKFLEKFLDTTKANLFFAKGLILVEGWAEEILLPSIAKNLGLNLTEKGVSIVNVSGIALDNYASIFIRNEEPWMEMPVAILTDCDVKEYQKVKEEYIKQDNDEIVTKSKDKIAAIKEKDIQNVKYFVAPHWTLEYSLYKSKCFHELLKVAAKAVHSGTDWDSDFEKALATKLLNKGLEKTHIAYHLANAIDEDLTNFEAKKISEKAINISKHSSDSINYIVKALNYACGIDN